RSVLRSRFPFTRHTDQGAAVDAGRAADLHPLLLVDAPAAGAVLAGIVDHLALSLAEVAGGVDAEERLLETHGSGALAPRADLGPGARFGAGPGTDGAVF